jgi:hypothetical protein
MLDSLPENHCHTCAIADDEPDENVEGGRVQHTKMPIKPLAHKLAQKTLKKHYTLQGLDTMGQMHLITLAP